MNRTDRLVAMVMELQGRRLVRAEELAAHFEISVRTVYRDIAALGEAGVPIVGEAGVGYTLVKGYQLPPVMFTTEEATALFVGGELVKTFTDASLHEPMALALGKLRAVLPRERQDHVERLVRHTLVLGHAPGVPDPAAQPWLLLIQRAVGMRRRLKMVYHGRERAAETAREIEPMGVVFYGSAWYVVGWCWLRNDFRHFKVDRIRNLELAEGTFEARPDFSLAEHMRATSKREETIAVRLWFSKEAQERAQRESHATLIRERERDGGAEFALYTWSLEWMAGWLLSFGGEAEALEPKKLRTLMAASAQKIIDSHRRNHS